MNVDLTPEMEKLISDKVSSGLYSSQSEVVCAALRLLLERDHKAKLDALKKDIQDGLNSGESIPLDMDEIKRSARNHKR